MFTIVEQGAESSFSKTLLCVLYDNVRREAAGIMDDNRLSAV
jgi:hypothetical protein